MVVQASRLRSFKLRNRDGYATMHMKMTRYRSLTQIGGHSGSRTEGRNQKVCLLQFCRGTARLGKTRARLLRLRFVGDIAFVG